MIFWAISWLILMILSVLILKYSNQQNTSLIEIGSLIVIVFFGIFSFSKFILIIEKAIKVKYSRIIGGFFSILAFIFSLGIGIGIMVLLINIIPNSNNKNVQAEKSKYALLQSPLKIGSSGEDVKVLQAVLKQNKNIYPSGIVSGYYGQLTKEAVTNFQIVNDLPRTGEVDEATISKINENYGAQSREQYLISIPTSIPVRFNPPVKNVVQTNVNSDPIVNCSVSTNCGGGYKSMKNSECNNTTCCKVGGKWYFYTDKNKCNQDQQAYNNSINNNYVYPTTSIYTYPTTAPQNNAVQNPTPPPPQPTVDNTEARARCIGDVNRALESAIVSYRVYCRANGCDNTVENIRLENEASIKREQCHSMYP